MTHTNGMSVLPVSSSSTVPNPSAGRLQAVRERLNAACVAAQRPTESVKLLAVSKTFSAQAVADMVSAGQAAFGENYIQEGVDKIADLAALRASAGLVWHCIGPIQSNKTRLVAEHFDWVQSVDRLKIAERLSAQRPTNLPPLQVCVQVNVDGGATKSGVQVSEATALAQAIHQLPGLQLRGLMCIPDPVDTFAAQVAIFGRARTLFDAWRAQGLPVDTLSMGMSSDLEAAVASGATMVRVGTALFGAR
jgi:pyridoxal phosphate enzyme (YggS family)